MRHQEQGCSHAQKYRREILARIAGQVFGHRQIDGETGLAAVDHGVTIGYRLRYRLRADRLRVAGAVQIHIARHLNGQQEENRFLATTKDRLIW